MTARIADFLHLDGLVADDEATLVAFLGGTIGNLEPDQRRRFFTGLDAELGHGDSLLLGADLVKDRARLVAAYNDARGVTAAFNRNVLAVLNRELGADFDLESVRARRDLRRGAQLDRDAPAIHSPPAGLGPGARAHA